MCMPYQLFLVAHLRRGPVPARLSIDLLLCSTPPLFFIFFPSLQKTSRHRVYKDNLCAAVCCSMLQLNAMGIAGCSSVLQCVAVCCSVLHSDTPCAAVCCTVSQCDMTLKCVAVCCGVTWLTRDSACCSVLQCVAVRCNHMCCSVLQSRVTWHTIEFAIPESCIYSVWGSCSTRVFPDAPLENTHVRPPSTHVSHTYVCIHRTSSWEYTRKSSIHTHVSHTFVLTSVLCHTRLQHNITRDCNTPSLENTHVGPQTLAENGWCVWV